MSNKEREQLRDDVYSNVAKEISRLSKDNNTHIGSIIVASDGTPISWGYNGTIAGFNDDVVPHSRLDESLSYTILEEETGGTHTYTFLSNKYPFMSHAESNAIFFAAKDKLVDSVIYVTGFPCENCALQIARAKIARVVVTENNIDIGSSIKSGTNHNAMFIFAQHGMKLTMNGKNYTLVCEKSN